MQDTGTVVSALADALAADPARPLVTYYDDATGERVELSVKTFDNWVSKISNFLTDELMLDPGDGLRLTLPTHWQSTVIAVAAWTSGLRLVGPTQRSVSVSVVGPEALAHADSVEGPVVACSLRPLGGRFAEPLPDGWLDFALEVPPQPDALLARPVLRPDDLAVQDDVPTTHADLVERGRRAAGAAGLDAGGRLLTDLNPASARGLATALAAPLVTGSSVVLVTHATAERRAVIGQQERVTTECWAML